MKYKYLIISFIIAAGFWSCKKAYDIPPADDTSSKSLLNVVNTTADTLNFYLNGTRQNVSSSIYSGGATGYLNVNSGTQSYDFKKNGSSVILFSKSVSLKDTTNQTLYVAGVTPDKIFFSTDTLVTSLTGATVRFVHTADGAGPLSVTINDVPLNSGQNFKSVSAFKVIDSGSETVKVYTTGSAVPSATQKLTFSVGNVYTLYVKGLPAGIGQSALTVGVFVNK